MNNRSKCRFSLLMIIFVCTVTFSVLLSAEETSTVRNKKILIIHSYHQGLVWTDGQDEGIREILAGQSNIEISSEYLDSKRIPFEKMSDYFAEFVKQKYAAASKTEPETTYGAITHEDFVYALSEFESFIDISENDLLKIYDLVTQRHQSTNIQYHELKHGHYYSNGEYADLWSVRQIVDWGDANDAGEEKLIYKVIAGADRRNSAVMTKNAFSRWAKHEVIRDEDNWRRVDGSE